MAFAGLKKQINKANQYVTEKMGAAEGTKLDDDFVEMEKKTDVTCELVEDLQIKTKEFLQPNPTSRAKMAAVRGISKLNGQARAATYSQPEGVLGEAMVIYGRKLGDESVFASALVETGEAMKQLADVKYALDDNVKQNFLDPLQHLQSKDIKEVMFHRKKLHGRRLDFDCKKRKQAKGSSVTDDEIRMAEEKFAESFQLAQMGMHNLLENDVEHVSQLASFAEALYEYHLQAVEILKDLTGTLQQQKNEVATKPRSNFVPKTALDLNGSPHLQQQQQQPSPGRITPSFGSSNGHNDQEHMKTSLASPAAPANWDPFGLSAESQVPAASPQQQHQLPCGQALYDFDPENPTELEFKEGDMITLVSRVDENWYEGTINGRTGLFPVNYIQVVVPLP